MTTAQTGGPALLTGRTALITAGASGMGRAGARLFGAHGAHVILVDVNAAGALAVAAEIEANGGSAEAHGADLCDQADLDRFVTAVKSRHEVLDVLHNHAGVTGPRGLEFDVASWNACMTLNAWVPAYLTQQLLPLLRGSDAASIINTASTAGLRGVAGLPVYSATKGAVIQFTKATALLLAPEGIRVNAICPGGTDTAGMRAAFQEGAVDASLSAIAATVPLGRVGQPEDIAAVALFLASDASKYMTGTVIPVDGGATV
ncbi:SDR family oxidoreductase [Streptomyces sp. NPDC093085]|uniref:SDR family NAD(P)-dependent oxidoreductase n=1 Tax=Streptomyces sp. NPDC093085 TaxID=3155068 RepID=UPI00343D4569